MRLSLDLGLGSVATLNAGGGVPSVLRAIAWDTAAYPLSITKSGDTWQSDFSRDDYLPDADFATTYYVDPTSGSDSNNGLSSGAKLKSLWKAVELGEATGGSYKVLVDPATSVPRANGFNFSGTTAITQPASFEVVGGEVTTGTYDNLTWTNDGSGTNTYSASRSNVARVIDPRDGSDLIKVADQATCQASAGSWAQVSSTLYVHLADGAVVSNTTARACLNINHIVTSNSLHLKGFNLIGGTGGGGCLHVNNMTDGVVVVENCSLRYAGSDAIARDSWVVENSTGLAVFQNCDWGDAAKDGGNAKGAVYVLTEGCAGTNFGRGTSTSNNAITGHDDVRWIDIEGAYSDARGGIVRFINDSRLAAFGSAAVTDFGDGVTSPTAWRVEGTSEFYLWDCSGDVGASEYALAAVDTSVIHIKNFDNISGLTSGDIRAF